MFITVGLWLKAHALLAWPLVSALLILVFRTRTPEEWVRLGETQPRIQGLLRLLRGVGLDPVKALEGLSQLLTGRTSIDARDAEIAMLRARLSTLVAAQAQATPPRSPLLGPSRTGQSGRAYVGPLAVFAAPALAFALLLACTHGCHPQPVPSSDGAVVSVGGWTDTARQVLSTIAWAVPAARAVITSILPAPAAAIVGRVLDTVADAAQRLRVALDAYSARGGDRCAVYAAVGALDAALSQLTQSLVDHGIALGAVFERAFDAVLSIADNLIPSCDATDAGWTSAGARGNAYIRSVERAAAARGVILRRDLDNIRPTGGAR